MSLPLFVVPAVKRRKLLTLLSGADYTGSTLTSSVYALTANGSATTTLTATVYKDGALASGETVTVTVQRITMNAADSFVSADPTDIDSDGVATSTITVQAAYSLDGEYIPLPGIAASAVVLSAATTTGNTLVQPATATDADGITTGTIKTTDASATKIITATIAGLAATDTATVTTDSGYVPPASGDPFFTENFDTGSRTDANGFTWGGATQSTVSNTYSHSASYSNKLAFDGVASGLDDRAEQRFNLGQNVTELWVEFELRLPSNYVHRNDSPNNNKFFRLWGDDYNAGNKVGASTFLTSGVSQIWYEYVYYTYTNQVGRGPNTAGARSTPVDYGTGTQTAMLGAWTNVRMHFKMPTAAENDGEWRLWYDGVLMEEFTAIPGKYDSDIPYWNTGYFYGTANSGYTDATDFYIDDVKFFVTDPGWV